MINKKESLKVIQDDNVNTEDYINVYTSNKETTFKKGMFVKIRSENVLNYMWIGQIVTSNSNMCPAISKPTDQTMLLALEDQSQKKDVIDGFGTNVFFKVKLLKKCYSYTVDNETYFDFEPIDSRPMFGSNVEQLNNEEIFELLKTPKYYSFSKNNSNAFGYSQTITDLPLCLNEKIFHTHLLVSGTTGSGKSNVNGHIIKIAQKYNKPVIIHDAKPDFELIEFLNSESKTMIKSERLKDREEQYQFNEIGLENVYKIGFEGIHDLSKNSKAFYDAFIYFDPSDFTPNELVKLFFYQEDDINSEEELLSILINHYEDINTNKIKKDFNIKDFLFHLETAIQYSNTKKEDQKNAIISNNNFEELIIDLSKIHSLTLKTMHRKINRRKMNYPWLRLGIEKDKRSSSNKSYGAIVKNMYDLVIKNTEKERHEKIREYYNSKKEEVYKERKNRKENLHRNNIVDFIKEKLKEHKENTPIFLIDYNFKNADITYSFIVNKLLKDIQELQDTEEQAENGIVQVIDEAHRLFSGLSKNFKDELMNSLNKVIKEGRVKRHSLVLSLQNASEVPDTALNNFGTKIALRQQSEQEARISTQGMGDNAAKDVMNLSPGQFLIKYPSGEFTFLGFGFLSPFQLRVE